MIRPRWHFIVWISGLVLLVGMSVASYLNWALASPPCGMCDSPQHPLYWQHAGSHCNGPECCDPCGGGEGAWYWLRTPEQEKRVVMNLYNRYCVRCHGVDGRGVWDIPDVPNFANPVWQASRSDDQLARLILEGRGACMPAFRGTMTLEEAFGMARYLRTFVPGTEVSPPEETAPKPMTSVQPSITGLDTSRVPNRR